MARWRALMRRHHCLGLERIVGCALYYVATLGNQWVDLLGWGSAAPKSAEIDGLAGVIGYVTGVCILLQTVCNFLFCLVGISPIPHHGYLP